MYFFLFYSGLPPSADRFDTCYKASVNLLKGKIQHVREIEDDHFCTISYYYDMAVDYGLIGKSFCLDICGGCFTHCELLTN